MRHRDVGGAGRQVNVPLKNWLARISRGAGSFAKMKPDLRAVGRRLAVGRVVHLQLDDAAGLEAQRGSRRETCGFVPGA